MEDSFRRIIREELVRARAELLALLRSEQVAVVASGECIPLADAAARFHVSTKTLRRWRDENKLTRYGEGRLARVDLNEVRQAMLSIGMAAKEDEKRAPSDDDLRALLARKTG